MSAGSTRTFSIPASACGIPTAAQAYSLNITVAPPAPLTYLTAWPTGETQPLVSTLNAYNGAIVANAAIVPAGAGGAINIYVSDTTQVIIDINGYFAPQGGVGPLAFYPVTPAGSPIHATPTDPSADHRSLPEQSAISPCRRAPAEFPRRRRPTR
jgi:hypothetical protein